MADPNDALGIADQLCRAIEAGDLDAVRALYADDVVVWANFDAKEQDRDTSMKILGWLCKKMGDRHYDVTRRIAIEGGYLQEHVLRGTAPDGSSIAMPACLIVRIEDGKITRIHEYLDPSAVTALST